MLAEFMETMRNNADNKTEVLVAQIKEIGARLQAQQDQADADAAARGAAEPDGDEKELMLSAMAEILKAQTAPRRYSIAKDPTSGKITLESLVAEAAANTQPEI
jgi:cobalamin biosynthesis protein CbiD